MNLPNCIEVSPDKRSGIPVLKGTRLPVAQIIAELAENQRLSKIVEDYELDEDLLVQLLQEISIHLNNSNLCRKVE